jgi:LysM repeat protein
VITLGDTLGALAARLGLTAADLAAVNADGEILAPSASLTLPADLRWPVATGATLSSLASAVGLDMDALVGRVGGLAGLIATGGDPLLVPDARRMDVDALVALLVSGEAAGGTTGTSDIAGMASHFLLNGLRVPEPPGTGPDRPVRALFDLGGQQFPAPQPVPDTYTVAFTVGGDDPWVAPVTIYEVRAGDTLETIADAFGVTVAAIERLNVGVDPSDLPPTLRIPPARSP